MQLVEMVLKLFVNVVRFRMQENAAASPHQLAAGRTHTNAAAATKPADEPLLVSSVPSPEDTPAQTPDLSSSSDTTPSNMRSTIPESVPPTVLPRAKLTEEPPLETRSGAPPATASKTRPQDDSLGSKLAPAAVSEGELIQPVRRPYINRSQPLANIMKGSIEMNESKDADFKFVRKSQELDAKEQPSETSKVPPSRGRLWVVFFIAMLVLRFVSFVQLHFSNNKLNLIRQNINRSNT